MAELGPAGLPVLDRLAADPARRRRARSTRRGSTSTRGWSTGCSQRGIRPVATLYHWDLPQELEDAGGWTDRETALRLRRRTPRIVAEALGDRVAHVDHAERAVVLGLPRLRAPACTPPAAPTRRAALAAVHHLNLAHGLAGAAVRDARRRRRRAVGHPQPARRSGRRPDSAADLDAVRRIDALANRVVPRPDAATAPTRPTCCADTAAVTDWSFVQRRRRGDRSRRRSTCSASTTTPPPLVPAPGTASRRGPSADGHGDVDGHAVGRRRRRRVPPAARPVHRDGLEHRPAGPDRAAAATAAASTPSLPLMITENGAAFDDVVVADGAGPRRRPHRLPAPAHRRRRRGHRRRRRRARLLRLVAAGQLRVGATATTRGSASSASTTTPRRAPEGQRPLVPAPGRHRKAGLGAGLKYPATPAPSLRPCPDERDACESS